MKLQPNYIILALSLFFFISCEKVIEFNGSITDPIMVVNSLVMPNAVVKAQLSKSRFFLSNDTLYTMIDTATVSLYVNGTLKEPLVHTLNGMFVGTYKPVVGDSIRLQVQIPSKQVMNCSTGIVPQTPIISVDTTRVLTGVNNVIVSVSAPKTGYVPVLDTIGISLGRKLNLLLKFNDNPAIRNFYRLVVYTKTYSGSKAITDYTFSFDDVVSGNTNRDSIGPPSSLSTNKFNVFSDDLFNGKQYALKFSVANNKELYLPGKTPLVTKKELYIDLQSISREYYLYLQTRSNAKNNNFFAEPVQVYTNVTGGIGILGSYTSNLIKINL
jgi:hypothetical protein